MNEVYNYCGLTLNGEKTDYLCVGKHNTVHAIGRREYNKILHGRHTRRHSTRNGRSV